MFILRVDEEIELHLRNLGQADDLFHLIDRNRDFLEPTMDWVHRHQCVEDTQRYQASVYKNFAERRSVTTLIYYQGGLVGSAAITLIDKTLRLAEVGYWLDQGHTGKGIATRAARAMVDYGFAVLGLHKIIIRAISTNEKSLAIAQRLGFRHQGLDIHEKLHHGEYYDYDVYYLLEDDWEQTISSLDFSAQVAEGLELRILEPRHAEALFQLVDTNRAHLREWMPWVDGTTSADDTAEFIDASLEQYGNQQGLNLGIWYEGELCGTIGYVYWDMIHKKTEIGYWLDRSHTGKGIITRCTQALVDYAFDVLRMNRIQISCGTGNKASCAVAERLGFKHEGLIRDGEWLYDHYHDLNVYALLAGERSR